MSVPKQKFTAEFKQEAVRLVRTTGKSCAQIARDLGVPPHYVVRWKQQQDTQTAAGRPAFTGRGIPALSPQEARLKELERELEIARQERDILKKALAFFAKQP
ncbi:transposase [Deinococcus sp. 14RED07]|jgi:transposase|uniref:Transposase n=2 Tax=Deinococcus TaxID=1298 RepID=A0A8H9GT42_9DEIO|nr:MULTISPECIES: transposase [Deinococcus]MCD0174587.1 transposase [Deinococcus sp. 14RED07]UBV41518.1 transposase [Deinococcus taeanensis]UBV42107.1 transposase [Deinococcus taeanensis]UBV44504.1 transposase [Deinococcus taeanensis]UBV44679.1 transposase [Deinococcus taeanensis]